jgi:hypothetical protein
VGTRRLAAAGVGLLGCLALSGCGGGTHEVLLAGQSNTGTVTMTYQVDGHAPITINSAPASNDSDSVATASVDLAMKAGAHVRITGTASTTSASTVSCTIAVDAVVKEAHIATAPATGRAATPLRCTTEGYISHRPYGLNHVFEVLAFAASLLIVAAALGSLVVNRRRG